MSLGPRLLAAGRFWAVILVWYVFGVGVSCRILHSIIIYLFISLNSGSVISVGEERASLSVIVYV